MGDFVPVQFVIFLGVHLIFKKYLVMAQPAREKGALTDRTRTLKLARTQVVLATKVI